MLFFSLILSTFAAAAAADGAVSVKEESGKLFYYDEKTALVSPWHDVPFESSEGLLSFVCEIPLGTTEKMEIHKSIEHNPIVQDVFKDGSLRYYKYGPSVVNYGAIAQTWESPSEVDPDIGLGGDNDPVDVLQLNDTPCERGAIQRVRVLGALALVDGGETDWKLLVVDVDDEDDSKRDWKELGDIPASRVDEVREWFRLYKTAEGKPENNYAFDGRAVGAAHAMRVAQRTHDYWRALVDEKAECLFESSACWVAQVISVRNPHRITFEEL